ncbi:hypothetical protein N7488_008318 [Penicillium malachiteum]|nr:hypothetical protein N7488_008318 [Penicillium malachiteum]
MAVQFCEDCGHLLPITAADKIPCTLCGTMARMHVSSSANFPSRLRTKLRSQTQAVSKKDLGDGPITEIECPKCSHPKATWTEAQLRSADEGSTIFYCCMECRHRWSENN